MTHGDQNAVSGYSVSLNGEGSSADVISRSVAKDNSYQKFDSRIIGNAPCSGHTECDAIIMDKARILAIPQLEANDLDAALIHEAAIGKIAGEQIIKLMTLGLTEEEAEEEEKKGNHVVKTEDGYRRIVAAPNPMQIVELDAVNALMDADQVVIAAGGGGIPVLEQGTTLKGASAVIEKDLIAGLLADGVEADMLIILTGEECVYKNYGTDKQEPIREMTCAQAQKYMAEREFGEGTMQPKIETALFYIGDYATRQVLITKLGSIEAAMAGQTGTIIKK